MKIDLPQPALAFPEPGFRERLDALVARGRAKGLELEVRLGKPATATAIAAAEKELGLTFPSELRLLHEHGSGGRIGHLTLIPLEEAVNATRRLRAREEEAPPLDVPRGELVALGHDLSGTPYAFRTEAAKHRVVWLDETTKQEHRFATLARFLDAAVVRAWAAALHRKAEVDRGDDLDDGPWLAAARAAELEIDPTLMRTRED